MSRVPRISVLSSESGEIANSCAERRCNCYCCNSTSRRACSYSCPTCYSAVLDISYKTYGGKTVNTTFTHDYGKDGATATDFLDDHPQDSVSACYYNPSNLSEVRPSRDFNSHRISWRVGSVRCHLHDVEVGGFGAFWHPPSVRLPGLFAHSVCATSSMVGRQDAHAAAIRLSSRRTGAGTQTRARAAARVSSRGARRRHGGMTTDNSRWAVVVERDPSIRV